MTRNGGSTTFLNLTQISVDRQKTKYMTLTNMLAYKHCLFFFLSELKVSAVLFRAVFCAQNRKKTSYGLLKILCFQGSDIKNIISGLYEDSISPLLLFNIWA